MEKMPGIKDTDDIAGIGFADDRSVLCHKLLRLGQAQLFVALYVVDLLVLIKTCRNRSA